MSRPTPRKARHNRHPSNRIPISDYESDAAAAAFTSATNPAAPSAGTQHYELPPHRTNTDLNLSALRRHLPSVRSILSIAANAVVYTLDASTSSAGWVKTGYEGTMFVCALAPQPNDPQARPRACVFILNRRGLDNVVVDLARVSHAETAEQLVALRVEGNGQQGAPEGEERVLGLWIHNDKEDTREVNWSMIEESWKYAREMGAFEGPDLEVGPATAVIGRRPSLSDLFAKQNGAVGV